MKKLALILIIPFSLLLGAQVASAQKTPMAPAGKQMKASTQRPAATAKTTWDSFKPETLSGTISIIEPGKKSIFVTSSGGVSFHFLVTKRTKIQIGGTSSTIAQLADQAHEQATVTFTARARGDVASSISVSS